MIREEEQEACHWKPKTPASTNDPRIGQVWASLGRLTSQSLSAHPAAMGLATGRTRSTGGLRVPHTNIAAPGPSEQDDLPKVFQKKHHWGGFLTQRAAGGGSGVPCSPLPIYGASQATPPRPLEKWTASPSGFVPLHEPLRERTLSLQVAGGGPEPETAFGAKLDRLKPPCADPDQGLRSGRGLLAGTGQGGL